MSKKIEISLLLIATMGVMSGITIVASLPLISKTFSEIPNIEFLSKMMLTIPSIIIAISAPIAGILVDKYGRLKPLYAGMALFVIGGSSGFYLDNFYYILMGRAILGISVALLMTSSTALIGDYFDEEQRHRFMSMQGMSIAIGGIVFITMGGLLAEWDWSYPFVVYALPILFIPLMIGALYEPKVHKHTQTESSMDGSLLSVYITAFFSMVLFYMLPTQLPYLIINSMHGDPKTIGFVISIAMVFNAITARQYSRLKRRFSYMQIYIFTFAIFSIGLFIISQADGISQLFYSTLFIGMGFGLIFVNTNSWFLSKVPPQKRGKASGVLASSFFLGQFSSPLIFQPIVDRYGIQGLFLIISIVAISLSIVLLIKDLKIDKHQRRESE
ncbi:MFS permease [hydrothermal vent metagenome]|uniref:MFS permease n=1 Tax=hydrothermal vent metagenome TaxID=652676 RepID=A0A1W1CEB3_9ZZZZ